VPIIEYGLNGPRGRGAMRVQAYWTGGSILMPPGYVYCTLDLGLSSWFCSATRSCAGSALRQSRKIVRQYCGICSNSDINSCWSCSLNGAVDVGSETMILGSRVRYPIYAVPCP
jgi:hypothetical protein